MDEKNKGLPPLHGGRKPPRSPMLGGRRRQNQQQAQVFDYGPAGQMHSGSQVIKSKGKIVPRLDLKQARPSGQHFNDEPQVEIIEDDSVQRKSAGQLEYQGDALYAEEAGYRSVQPHFAASYNPTELGVVDECMV